MKFEFNLPIFEKVPNIKFRQNSSIGSQVVQCGQTDMKVTVAFCNFANAPKHDLLTPTFDTLLTIYM